MDLRQESERLLWRYLIEVVEPFGLCPWARRARERGEIRVEIVTEVAEVEAAVAEIAGDPGAALGMAVLAAAPIDPHGLRRLRDRVAAIRRSPPVGIADFHPDAAPDLSSAQRAIPWLRRAPDPLLQVVRLDVLASARAAAPPPGLAAQAAILAGHGPPALASVSDLVATANLATARSRTDAIAAAVAAIHADRDRTYAAIRASSRSR
jgi:hypothetical protein